MSFVNTPQHNTQNEMSPLHLTYPRRSSGKLTWRQYHAHEYLSEGQLYQSCAQLKIKGFVQSCQFLDLKTLWRQVAVTVTTEPPQQDDNTPALILTLNQITERLRHWTLFGLVVIARAHGLVNIFIFLNIYQISQCKDIFL